MSEQNRQPLLSPLDPPPVRLFNGEGNSAFLLLGDHAGNAVPARLGTLGLDGRDLSRHIGWDIGVDGLGRSLAGILDAPFLSQTYSRLVIDCNRDPAASDAILEVSDRTPIPGNHALGANERSDRIRDIHRPYHDALADILARRDAVGYPTLLVSLHSFTPSMDGFDRPWEIGVLYQGGNTALARALLQVLAEHGNLAVGDNQPYAMDETDYTLPRHAYPAGRLYVEIEIRQDLLAKLHQRERWAAQLSVWLSAGATRLAAAPGLGRGVENDGGQPGGERAVDGV